MKEYIIAALASICFANSVQADEEVQYENTFLSSQNESVKLLKSSKYIKLKESFNFKKKDDKSKIIYNTTPTKWTKVK